MKFHSMMHTVHRTFGALALLSLVAISTAQTVDNKPEVKAEVLERVNKLITQQAYVPGIDLNQWPTFIASYKDKLDAAKDDEEFSRSINEALSKFGASHFHLATPRAAETRKNAALVGIGITQQQVADGLLIIRTVPKAPAAEAGLVPGDIITKVDGKKAEGTKGIPGKEGTEVKLTVKRADGKTKDFKLTRKKFSTIRPEELIEEKPDTGRIIIYTFDFTYSRSNVESLMKQAQKYQNLIVDLRGNGGGAVVNLQHFLGLLLPTDAPVGTFINKQLVTSYEKETGTKTPDVHKIAQWARGQSNWSAQMVRGFKNKSVTPYKGKVAVLVDAFSGSASEMCAEALKDTLGADVIGTRSAGAVLASLIMPVTNQFTLQIPVMDYITTKGYRLEGNGVTPDVEAKQARMTLPGEKDVAVEKAQMLFARAKLREERSGGSN